jgi:hypothetical protein
MTQSSLKPQVSSSRMEARGWSARIFLNHGSLIRGLTGTPRDTCDCIVAMDAFQCAYLDAVGHTAVATSK